MALDMSLGALRERVATLEERYRALGDYHIINANAHNEILKRLNDLATRIETHEADQH